MLFAPITLAIDNTTKEPFHPLKTDNPPVIDGVLDDAVWKEAPWETGFKTWYPDYEVEMVENTKVWYAYDNENLYFAYRCYDSQPDKIKASVNSRDKIGSDDWVCLNLDTFNDQQSLYALYVNPRGIQMDSRATGNNEDHSIDIVFFSEGRIDDEGYTIEIRIPLKSLRFSQAETVQMGIIFERRISRTSELGTYPALDPKQGPNFYTQMRPLEYQGIKHYNIIEVLPGFTYGKNSDIVQDKLKSGAGKGDVSVSAKYGITSDLIMDGTINPDFSQVEADAGQVDFNQRFALFYPEKRSFFLEGRENFGFGGNSHGDPLGAIVHTRTIANPNVGLKFTGKIGEKNTIASIYALDDLPGELDQGDYANVGILRYKRTLNRDSFIGGFLTARELDNSYNRVGGFDGQYRITGSSNMGVHGFFSQDKNNSSGIDKNGHAVGLNYYVDSRAWMMNIRLQDLSEDFNTETGYVTRTGVTRTRAGFIKRFYPKNSIIKRIDPLLNLMYIRDKASKDWERMNQLAFTFILPRSTRLRFSYIDMTEIYEREEFDTGGFSFNSSSQLTRQFFWSVNYSYTNRIRYVREFPFQGIGSTASASINYQPTPNVHSTLDYTYSDLNRKSDDKTIYVYKIIRSRNTYQMNKYLFFRAIAEYNVFHKRLKTDFLASYTYIPGTVIHFGYGSMYLKQKWNVDRFVDTDDLIEHKRGLFFKASYLWRF